MAYTTFFIDLDDTIYPASSGLWAAIRQRMEVYMHERLGIAIAEIPALRVDLYKKHGTTMRGLKALYGIDEPEFLAFVHDLPLGQYLHPEPRLRQVLMQYPQKKIVFTNADERHAGRVLDFFGISDCFSGIIDVMSSKPYCKPQLEAYQAALLAAGSPRPEECVMFDDAPRNLAAAREAGMFAVYVGDQQCEAADASIPSLLHLPSILSANGSR